jgi:hypothetical protein
MVPWIFSGVALLVVVGAGVLVFRFLVLVGDVDAAEWDEADPADWDRTDGDAFTAWSRERSERRG